VANRDVRMYAGRRGQPLLVILYGIWKDFFLQRGGCVANRDVRMYAGRRGQPLLVLSYGIWKDFFLQITFPGKQASYLSP